MSQTTAVIRKLGPLRKRIAGWRADGQTVALLPTMGALHTGHLRLVKLARKKCDRAIVSIFINPAQFAPNEDLERYPRNLTEDLSLLDECGVDLVWAPSVNDMYPDGFATQIVPAGAGLGLETEFRPQFFTGVATVCTKLFIQVSPDIAIFGEKDYQQLQVIRQLVRDLDLPMKIQASPTIRERDGLAMSSRNAYLNEEERIIAPLLSAQIRAVAAKVKAGGNIGRATAGAKKTLAKAGFNVDYVEVRDACSLAIVKTGHKDALRVLAAAWLGKTRLIDNCAV